MARTLYQAEEPGQRRTLPSGSDLERGSVLDAPARRNRSEAQAKETRDRVIAERRVQRIGGGKDSIVDGVAAEGDNILIQVARLGTLAVLQMAEYQLESARLPREVTAVLTRMLQGIVGFVTAVELFDASHSGSEDPVSVCERAHFVRPFRYMHGEAKTKRTRLNGIDPKVATSRIEQDIERLPGSADLDCAVHPESVSPAAINQRAIRGDETSRRRSVHDIERLTVCSGEDAQGSAAGFPGSA